MPSTGSSRPARIGIELRPPPYPDLTDRERWVTAVVRHARTAGIGLIHAGTGPGAEALVPAIEQALERDPSTAVIVRRTLELRAPAAAGGTRAPRPARFVEWDAGATPRPQWTARAEALHALVGRVEADAWGFALERGHDGPEVAPAIAAARPAWVRLPFHLLSAPATRALVDELGRQGDSLIASDPFAGGRLNGELLRAPVLDRPKPTRPLDLDATRREYAPLLALAFLTEARTRTMAAAALQYLLHRPPVSAVLVPIRAREEIDQIVEMRASPRLSEEERARIEGRSGSRPPAG